MEKKEFNKLIAEVQSEIKAPKNLYNDFGKYAYRSAEAILEVAKPILHNHGLILTISDDIVMLGDRFYIKAVATLSDGENTITTTAFARECNEKKGMDEAQITGSASSYARKYALNGLFCLDDNKDPDAMDNTASVPTNKPAAPVQNAGDIIGNMKLFCREKYNMYNNSNDKKKADRVTAFVKYYEKKLTTGWEGDFKLEKLFENWMNKEF